METNKIREDIEQRQKDKLPMFAKIVLKKVHRYDHFNKPIYGFEFMQVQSCSNHFLKGKLVKKNNRNYSIMPKYLLDLQWLNYDPSTIKPHNSLNVPVQRIAGKYRDDRARSNKRVEEGKTRNIYR